MMICKNLILNDNFDYEFPYDEAELLAELKNYVEIFGKIRKTYWNMEEDSYEKTVYLWIGNLYEYIVEGFNKTKEKYILENTRRGLGKMKNFQKCDIYLFIY
ncbi:hypothetical protein [Fusobacterium sp.]|uniref:hypothetical protein n=1 Tax=Fusobacterium sp. TaxID=68766 RepID=UPI002F3FC465